MAKASSFLCPSCDKQFRWEKKYAGRKVKCPQCKAVIRVPSEPAKSAKLIRSSPAKDTLQLDPSERSGSSYELDVDASSQVGAVASQAAVKNTGKCPSCSAKLSPEALICIQCGFNFNEGKQIKVDTDQNPSGAGRPIAGIPLNARQKEDESRREQKKIDLQLPITLIVFGVILILVNLLVLAPRVQADVATGERLKWMGLQVFSQFVFMMPCYFLAVRLLHAGLGVMGKAILKMAGLALIIIGLSVCIQSALTMTNAGFDANYINWGIRAFVISTIFWLIGSKKFEIEPMPALVLLLLLVLVPIFGIDCVREFLV